MDKSKEEILEKIAKVHKIVVKGLCNPLLTQTSKKCDFKLRGILFESAYRCVWDLKNNPNYFDDDFEELKKFVKRVENERNN